MESLMEAAKNLGFGFVFSNQSNLRLEVPAGSGSFIKAKKRDDDSAYALIVSVEINDAQVERIQSVDIGLRRESIFDLLSYLCLFEVEYDANIIDDTFRHVKLISIWLSESGESGLYSAVRVLLRAKEGVLNKIRYWLQRLERMDSGR